MDYAIIFAFGAMVFWGLGDFLIQRAIYRFGRIETLFIITAASSLLLIPFIIPTFYKISPLEWLSLFILGLVVFAGSHIHFLALEKGKLAVVEMIVGLELPLTIFLGIIVLGEAMTPLFFILAALVFIGIVLVSVNFTNLKAKNFLEKGALLAVMAAFLLAVMNFLTAVSSQDLSSFEVIAWPWFVVFLISGTLLFKKNRLVTLAKELVPAWKLVFFVIVIDIAAWLFYASALAGQDLSVITAITGSYIVIAFILGIVVNREVVSRWQVLGAALALTASVSIALLV